MSERTRVLRTDYLARVEGEGAMYVRLDGRKVVDVKLRIYEPPRFFEALLRGRAFTEAPDITARICGICPVAYQMSAVRAMEDACGVQIDDGPLRDLRRLIYCGEWIESHSLHVYMLHAPDFLGYAGAVEMAREHRAIVEEGLLMKRAGNALMALVGGREVHPINVRVGGFYRVPRRRELHTLVEQLEAARDTALATVRWASELPFPEVDCTTELVALTDPGGEYPIDRGTIRSDRGLDIVPAQFDEHIVEDHVEHSNALHARIRERGTYLTGPLARYALSASALGALARGAARDAGLGEVCTNPFQSIVVRGVELVQACDEALSIIGRYEEPDAPAIEVVPRSAVGHGATEAPRGLLYHRYELAEDGAILDARIVPPTSQNQLAIEENLRAVVEDGVDLSDQQLTLRCEQAIRNHDPCISCATHFLTLTVDRG
ncbi:MAG TPA: nickel-dependent hydrogenase large subunit [Solirubrobacteraceae bacterium]|nr:nickel-dependent hydrogenase large subunit [Solirubrobacteraceae bacterium]